MLNKHDIGCHSNCATVYISRTPMRPQLHVLPLGKEPRSVHASTPDHGGVRFPAHPGPWRILRRVTVSAGRSGHWGMFQAVPVQVPVPDLPGDGDESPVPGLLKSGLLPRPRPRFAEIGHAPPSPSPDLLKSGTKLH